MAQHPLFAGHSAVRAHALCVGGRIDLRTLEKTHRLASAPLVLPAGACGCAVLFRYGVVVLFDLEPIEEGAFLAQIGAFVQQPFPQPQSEELGLRVAPGAAESLDEGILTLPALDIVRVQIAADVLAKSVVLAQHEAEIASAFDRIEPLAESLRRKGRVSAGGRELLRQLGGNLLVQQRMVVRVEVSEKPEVLWDRPEHERLYARLADEYETRDRHLALERKLALVSQTAETLLDLLQQSRSLRVEWYIVVLIVVEILLTVYAMLPRG
jgi:uncharacterized Rmd1/YagE family protein